MIEKINKVNDVLEQLVSKLKSNYERLERRAIQAERDIDDEATSTEYEALAILKKDAIMNKILYQYYSQKLKKVMDRAENSIVEMAAINENSNSFELEIRAKDFTNINIEELCKGVKNEAITSDILNSFEMFSGSSVEGSTPNKIRYESDEKCNYKIEETDDDYILLNAGSDVEPGVFEYAECPVNVGSDVEPMSEEDLACSYAEPISFDALDCPENIGSDAEPMIEDELAGSDVEPGVFEYAECPLKAGSDVEPMSDEDLACSYAEPMSEDKMGFSYSAPMSEEDLAGSDVEPGVFEYDDCPENVGSDVEPMSDEDLACSYAEPLSGEDMAGSDVEPEIFAVEECPLKAGSDVEPMSEEDLACSYAEPGEYGIDECPESAGSDAEPMKASRAKKTDSTKATKKKKTTTKKTTDTKNKKTKFTEN